MAVVQLDGGDEVVQPADIGRLTVITREYGDQKAQLLPHGKAWPRQGSLLRRLVDAGALPFARVDYRARQLLDEAFPNTADELLDKWEQLVGDSCGTSTTLEGRQRSVTAKLTQRSSPSRRWIEQLARALGYSGVDVTKLHNPFKCSGTCSQVLRGPEGGWTWSALVRLPESTEYDHLFRCLVTEASQSHTYLVFEFGE